ncbi:stromal membrane-associated protein [Cryptococcus wingfieldii CBS 7118]|uniref:Stromal membrane-associated protein n=1 Tax=Cryptococcus wingfieldii CBS 7118 TaxID=1295528 RepID=A0A1E3IY50_9TREE|nr:stromal membrane-associated protein [Cryptococcus wingfieldii CBS 7118]ODN92826.1 stromal membrane-associated protein [Cryptococcus wingfieldii CBS 7118]
MSRQDKATTERNARILRDLVKQPENKSCADCKRNDTRWASWNLGLYLCIRCSGIHRSMGTHISKVKSIDLDIWTPEQMENIQRWGNTRANRYWERHLKAGHVPPDHKIESFIRSKYESRRWAMDGPPPAPETLDSDTSSASAPPPAPASRPTSSAPTPTTTAAPPVPAHLPKTHPLLSRSVAANKASPSKPTPAAKAPIIDLIGDDEAPAATTAAAPAPTQAPAPTSPAPAAASTGSSIFDLDFRAPSATPSSTTSPISSAPAPRSAKADIMSLFSTPSPSASASASAGPNVAGGFFAPPGGVQGQSQYANWGGGVTSSAPPVQQNPTQAPVPTQSNLWGGFNDQAAWGAPQSAAPQQQQVQVQPPLYAQPQQAQQNVSANPWTQAGGASDPWASNSSGGGAGFFGAGSGAAQAQPLAKKDDRDPFANIWA